MGRIRDAWRRAMPGDPAAYRAAVALLLAGIALRAVLAATNIQSYDDHVEVIRVIAYEDRMPAPDELWEAFQPKLYHVTVAAVFDLLPPLPLWLQYRVAQGVSLGAGLVTIAILLLALGDVRLSDRTRLLGVGMIALAPPLVSVGFQATNDGFVTALASLALLAGRRLFDAPTPGRLAVFAGAVALAPVGKGNGLVVAIAAGCMFAGLLLRPGSLERGRVAGMALACLLVFALVTPVLGGYWGHYQRTGNPFAINDEPEPAPKLFEPTYAERPGIVTIAGGFATLRLVDMLRHPENTIDDHVYPLHRTSLWSQMYGGLHSLHYPGFLDSWRLEPPWDPGRWLVRAALLLGLVPTAVLLSGLVRNAYRSAQWLLLGRDAVTPGDVFLTACALGYVAFQVVYAFRFRDFSFMKTIFLCPAAVAYLLLTARELDHWLAALGAGAARALVAAHGALLAVYFLETSLLALQLSAMVAVAFGFVAAS